MYVGSERCNEQPSEGNEDEMMKAIESETGLPLLRCYGDPSAISTAELSGGAMMHGNSHGQVPRVVKYGVDPAASRTEAFVGKPFRL